MGGLQLKCCSCTRCAGQDRAGWVWVRCKPGWGGVQSSLQLVAQKLPHQSIRDLKWLAQLTDAATCIHQHPACRHPGPRFP